MKRLITSAVYQILSRSQQSVVCEGHVARMGRLEMRTKFCQKITKERDHLGDLGVDERTKKS
jgi:hypothetical protein